MVESILGKKKIIAILVVIIIIALLKYDSYNKIERAKSELKMEYEKVLLQIKEEKGNKIKELEEKVSKRSDIEIFGELVVTHRAKADENKIKAEHFMVQSENDQAKASCYQQQVNRIVERKEYDKSFCDSEENLETFRTNPSN